MSRGPGSEASPRPWWKHRRVLGVMIGTLAVGAFLLWGPIGLGNGPLNAGIGPTTGGADLSGGPLGFIIPIQYSGHASGVIDGIDLIGGTRYASPHVLAPEVLTSGQCGGGAPTRPSGRGFVIPGCGGAYSGPLIGHEFGPASPHFFGFTAAARVAAPRPGTCWVMTKVVVHYHVGIRHYSASDPYRLAVCASIAQVRSAMDAAEAAG